jgi:peptide/nickel transport system substrate-binding protein
MQDGNITRGGTQKVKKRYAAAFMAAAMVAVVGCSTPKQSDPGTGDTGSGKPVAGGTLNLSMFSAPKGVFNPLLSETQYDQNVNDLVYNGLLKLTDKLEYVCDLCKTFTVSDDNKTVTFELLSDLQWHDGKPVTTADVVFTFQAILHPEYTGVRTGDYAALKGVTKMLEDRAAVDAQLEEKKLSAEQAAAKKKEAWEAWLAGDGKTAMNAVDAKKISFTTDEPYAPLLQSLAAQIVAKHAFDENIAQMASHVATKKPIGTGPYKFVEYKTDQFVKLVRNDNFHIAKPYIETVLYKIVDQSSSVGQLTAGELDFIPLKPDEVKLVENEEGIKVYTRADFGYQYMGLNHDNPLFKDQKVRQALMYGINRQAIVDKLLHKMGTVMNSHMPPALWAYDEKSLNPYKFDQAKAAQLLSDAGWTEKNSEGYLVKDGKVFEFALKYPKGNKVREDSAPLIQANFKDIGIKVNLEMIADFSTLSDAVFTQRKFDAYLMGWSLSTDPDPGQIFLPDNTWGKVTGWTSTRNEELIKSGTKVLKVDERKPLYTEWAKILNEELPYIFLYSQNVVDAVRTDKVHGLNPDARGTLWNIWELHIPKEKH